MGNAARAGIAAVIFICWVILSASLSAGCGFPQPENRSPARGLVRLYTSVPDSTAASVEKRFEKDHPGVDLEVFRDGTGQIMSQISQEAQTGAVQADVVWLADPAAAEALKEQGLLVPYISPQSEHMPPALMEPNGYYTGSRIINVVVGYNRDLVEEAPSSYRDLLNPAYFGKIGLVSPEHSGASAYAVGVMMLEPDYGWEYFYHLHHNGCQVVGDNQQMADSIARGDLAMGLVLDYMVRQIQASDPQTPLRCQFFADGVIAMASPVAIMRDRQDDADARLFIDWLLSETGQMCLAEEASTMPVNAGIKLPEGMPGLQEVKVIPASNQDIYRKNDNIFRIYREIFAGRPLEEIDATLEE